MFVVKLISVSTHGKRGGDIINQSLWPSKDGQHLVGSCGHIISGKKLVATLTTTNVLLSAL